jgi:hypothetical protein
MKVYQTDRRIGKDAPARHCISNFNNVLGFNSLHNFNNSLGGTER